MIKNLKWYLPELGKIKIGSKGKEITTKTGNKMRLPEKHDRFIITTTERGSDDNFIPDMELMSEIANKTGQETENLKFIPVTLLYNDIESNCQTAYERYKGKSCICRGDGETAKTDTGQKITCPCNHLEGDRPTCKPSARLSVLIDGAECVGGVHVFRTHGWKSTNNLIASMGVISMFAGRLNGIPLKMFVWKSAGTDKNGKPRQIIQVSLKYDGTPGSLIKIGSQISQNHIEAKNPPRIAYEPESESDIADEFYPEKPKTPEIPQPPKKILTVDEISDMLDDINDMKSLKKWWELCQESVKAIPDQDIRDGIIETKNKMKEKFNENKKHL